MRFLLQPKMKEENKLVDFMEAGDDVNIKLNDTLVAWFDGGDMEFKIGVTALEAQSIKLKVLP